MISYQYGRWKRACSLRGAKATIRGLTQWPSIRGDVMTAIIELEAWEKIAGCCCGTLASACCIDLER